MSNQQEFLLPDIGEGIVECEVISWLVKEGEKVVEDQVVCEVMTDKVTVEIPSKYTGYISHLHFKEGEIAIIDKPLFTIDVDSEDERENTGTNDNPVESSQTNDESCFNEQPQPDTPQLCNTRQTQTTTTAVASPAVRRFAREMDIDITQVPGSGKQGRVYKQDIENYLNQTTSVGFVSPVSHSDAMEVKREKITGVRKQMFHRMAQAVAEVAHFTYTDECHLNQLIDAKMKLQQWLLKQPEADEKPVKLTYLAFVVKALSLTLNKYPLLNARISEDNSELIYHSDHNIGIAIDSPDGLVVANIKAVQKKTIIDIANHIDRLATKAKQRKLSKEDISGGTISVSNIGTIGGQAATPIINQPELAIVALGKIQTLPRFDENNEVVQANIMSFSWSADHRVIDGATMVRFGNTWKSYLEDPILMLAQQ